MPVPAAVGVDLSQQGTLMLVDGGHWRRASSLSTPTDGYFTRLEPSSPITLLEQSQFSIRTSITAWLAGWLDSDSVLSLRNGSCCRMNETGGFGIRGDPKRVDECVLLRLIWLGIQPAVEASSI